MHTYVGGIDYYNGNSIEKKLGHFEFAAAIITDLLILIEDAATVGAVIDQSRNSKPL